MAWPYEAYVTLLTDLLSQNELPQGSLASIAEQVGTVEDAGLGRLVSAMLQSPTLYGQASQYQASTSSKPAEYVELAAAQNVFHAVRQGVDNRVQQLKKSKGHTWAKRRKLQKTLQHAHDVISECANNGDAASSAKALVLWVAILRGIQDHCVRKDALFKSESSIVQTCERHAISSIFQHITYLPALASKQLPDDQSLLVAWLQAQVVPEMPSERLRPLARPAFLDFAFSYIRMCFLDGHILADLPNDVYESSDGIIWPPDSPSSRCLSTVKGSLSHTILGRFSRSLGKVIESVSSTDMFVLLLPRFGCLETLAYRIHEDWARCVWADIAGIEDLHPNTRGRDEPWTIFKTLLFTMTMIFSSLISLMNSMPLSTSRAPSEPILNLASCALRTFSSIYFVTSKFGTNGFGAYQNVWYGAVDLVNRAPPAKIEQIAKTCEPYFEVTERRDTVLSRVLPRTRMTYWLNLVEQLILPMPEDYLSVTVIPALRPYLVEKRDAEAFESAHSVILAMFTHKKSLAIDVSAWYTDLLLDSYPERLTISQLRLAYASMVGCLTELAPGNVGPCISKLLQVIEHHPAGPSSVSSTDIPLAEISHSSSGGAPPSDTPQTAAKSLEIAALHSTRGHLLLVLIDQLSAVHLDMMERLLPKIRELLHEERKAPREARIALIQVLFNTLSGAMDMIKRESAAKWWLEHRAEIQEDENREDLKPIADTMKTSTPVVQAKM